jgi:hypothetical protein
MPNEASGMSVTRIMLFVGIAVGVMIALLALDRLGLWMECRGWMYYRHRRPEPGATDSTMQQMQSFIQPEIREVIEAQEQEKSQEKGGQGELMLSEDDGDDPDTHGTQTRFQVDA